MSGVTPRFCPACGKSLSAASAAADQKSQCPHCNAIFAVEAPAEPFATADAVNVSEDPGAAVSMGLPTTIGRYEIRAELGRGAFGIVYRAFDPNLDRDVAIKALHAHVLDDDTVLARFRREAQVVANMLHPHIVPVFDSGEEDGGIYIVSAFIEGQSLHHMIRGRQIDQAEAVRLSVQLAEALAYAHDKGILHRDVKPLNMHVDVKGDLYLMDFGLAGLLENQTRRQTEEGSFLGTLSYMAPEQAMGELDDIGPTADQYSAGVVLYEMLAGRLPFEADNFAGIMYQVLELAPPPLRELRKDVDRALENLCLKALAKDPEERFGSCQEFAEALRNWVPGSATETEGTANEMPVTPAWRGPTANREKPQPQIAEPTLVKKPAPPSEAKRDWRRRHTREAAQVPWPTQKKNSSGSWPMVVVMGGTVVIGLALTVFALAARSNWFQRDPEVVAPATQSVAPATQLVAPTTQIVAPTTQLVAPTTTVAPPIGTPSNGPLVKPRDLAEIDLALAKIIGEYKTLIETGSDGTANLKQVAPVRFPDWLAAAEGGSANGQWLAARCLEEGFGTDQDLAKALEWFAKAASNGNILAQFDLAAMYANDRRPIKDDVKAAEWCRKAADQNFAPAQDKLAAMYENGRGVAQDDILAAQWYLKAADQGFAPAQYKIGVLYENGRGVVKDVAKALAYFKTAADQGHALAQANLGSMYEAGRGVDKDESKAAQWYLKSAQQGDAGSQYKVGAMYQNGRGLPVDNSKAAEWYRKAADQGHAAALASLGYLYENGLGVETNYDKSVELYKEAAEKGNAMGQNSLGFAYEKGRGVQKDALKAVEWYRKAADQGDDWGQFNMGYVYEHGVGVSKDLQAALSWYELAARQGHFNAQTAVERLRKK